MDLSIQTLLGSALLIAAAIGGLILWLRSRGPSGTIVPFTVQERDVISSPLDAAEARIEEAIQLDPALKCLAAMHLVVRLQDVLRDSGHEELAREMDRLYPALRWSKEDSA
jgi:hypothetical protein